MTIDKHNPQLTSGEKASLKKKLHQQNLALSNPRVSQENKEKSEAKRARRKELGSTKAFK